MRILFVWLTAISLIGITFIGWYTSQPVVIGIARALNSSITDPNGRNVATTIEYGSYIWGPLFITLLLGWAILSSAKYDAESQVYG